MVASSVKSLDPFCRWAMLSRSSVQRFSYNNVISPWPSVRVESQTTGPETESSPAAGLDSASLRHGVSEGTWQEDEDEVLWWRWGEMLRRKEKVKRDVFLTLFDGEWLRVQASSAVGLEKSRPVEETITDNSQNLYIYTYTWENTHGWKNLQRVSAVTQSVWLGQWEHQQSTAPPSGRTPQAPICPYLSRTPPSGSQRSASWSVRRSPPPTCPRWKAHSCWRPGERLLRTPHSCSTWGEEPGQRKGLVKGREQMILRIWIIIGKIFCI